MTAIHLRDKRQRIWGGLALFGLLALVAIPATRSILQCQLRAGSELFGLHEDAGRTAAQAKRIMEQGPGDPGLRFAYATRWAETLPLEKPRDGEMVSEFDDPHLAREIGPLTAVQETHPHDPLLSAALLQRLATTRLILRRPEEYLVVRGKSPGTDEKVPQQNTPSDLALFERVAAGGEQADPANGYFPLMRSVGLLISRRDTEARAAIIRAGYCTGWNDYSTAQAEGKVKMNAALTGSTNTLARIEGWASSRYSSLYALRGVARTATGLAAQDELAGWREDGFLLRRALTHIGGQMRAKSSTHTGSLVGVSLAAIARKRPGGAALPPDEGRSGGREGSDRRAALATETYAAYLTQIGHPEEAAVTRAEYDRGLLCKEASHRGLERGALSPYSVLSLSVGWAGVTVLASNILCLLVLGGAAAMLIRTRRIGQEEGLPPLVSLGLVLLLVSGGGVITYYGWWEGAAWACLYAAVPLFLISIIAWRSKQPMSVALVRGFRRLALPVATGLTLMYVVVVAGVAVGEAKASVAFDQISRNEGKYLANYAGVEWPAPPDAIPSAK